MATVKGTPLDFLKKQEVFRFVKLEELQALEQRLSQYIFLRTQSLSQQIVALCLHTGITPGELFDRFHDQEAQDVFMEAVSKLEQERLVTLGLNKQENGKESGNTGGETSSSGANVSRETVAQTGTEGDTPAETSSGTPESGSPKPGETENQEAAA